MLGYTNPWANLLRKQCEAAPVMTQGVYDVVLSLLVDVPFAMQVRGIHSPWLSIKQTKHTFIL